MKLSQLKDALLTLDQIRFVLPDGSEVPPHFHVTEVGTVDKKFIDCGGTIRKESVINFQLFTAQDFDHRLSVQKLRSIIELSENKLGLEDLEIEVEYQSETIGKYGLSLEGNSLLLISKNTACLATDKCGIPVEKSKVNLSNLNKTKNNSCTPGSGCC